MEQIQKVMKQRQEAVEQMIEETRKLVGKAMESLEGGQTTAQTGVSTKERSRKEKIRDVLTKEERQAYLATCKVRGVKAGRELLNIYLGEC